MIETGNGASLTTRPACRSVGTGLAARPNEIQGSPLRPSRASLADGKLCRSQLRWVFVQPAPEVCKCNTLLCSATLVLERVLIRVLGLQLLDNLLVLMMVLVMA